MTKKRQLEIMLQKLERLEAPSASLEQYNTPPQIAADVLWEAYSAGDVAGRTVVDMGCGNGVFCIGAKLLGASRAVGVDVDRRAIGKAFENAASLSVDVELVERDVAEFRGSFDTVIQNPPFGAQRRHADRPFIEKSVELAPRSYSLHLEDTIGFVSSMVSSLGATAVPLKRYKFEIPYAFEFHRKKVEKVPVILLRFERR